ncbi:acetyl-CoA C-acetyltransferase [Sinisalibacter aestuarii]|uniref:Acetyl-CoA acetyltransferase n=1 Tax=Sinisalibacter aestuarii TaxID=2949426 RepID=A0ABQ5LYD5_9RHOB|nr:acetyl-CoA C-acetyltransferase [Sinisalibacter aestuarii]GKY89975.1 acetyl-CoA acetyltransferase [Sinisalibacter aestuarii]
MGEAYIVAARRTAGGRRKGRLRGWHPAALAARVLEDLVAQTGIDPALIEDVIMGCVSQGGEQSTQVGRNAILASSLPDSIPAVTIDRQCGSSQQAVQFAAQAVMSGTQDIVIAAGVESMTRVPMGSPVTLYKEAGIGTGPYPDAVEARYGTRNISQFIGAEMIAEKHGFSKERMDAFALESHRRAAAATRAGAFRAEIIPLQGLDETGDPVLHDTDEGIRYDATPESIAAVRPLTEKNLITAATASQMCDGASGVMVVSERALKAHGLVPLARIHSFCVTAGDPVIMLEEPLRATDVALERAGMSLGEIDLFEVNEAFASVPMAWLKHTGADPDKLNVNGGAIALGHPLGGTGTKLMSTLIHTLRARGERYGMQAMCEGGGIANVTILEAL